MKYKFVFRESVYTFEHGMQVVPGDYIRNTEQGILCKVLDSSESAHTKDILLIAIPCEKPDPATFSLIHNIQPTKHNGEYSKVLYTLR